MAMGSTQPRSATAPACKGWPIGSTPSAALSRFGAPLVRELRSPVGCHPRSRVMDDAEFALICTRRSRDRPPQRRGRDDVHPDRARPHPALRALGRVPWYAQYRVPAEFGGDEITMRLHVNDEDVKN